MLLLRPDLVSGDRFRRRCLVQTPIAGQTPAWLPPAPPRLFTATPGKRLQALSGAFNVSGSEHQGFGAAYASNQRAGAAGRLRCGHGRGVLEGILTSVDLLWLAARPSGSS